MFTCCRNKNQVKSEIQINSMKSSYFNGGFKSKIWHLTRWALLQRKKFVKLIYYVYRTVMNLFWAMFIKCCQKMLSQFCTLTAVEFQSISANNSTTTISCNKLAYHSKHTIVFRYIVWIWQEFCLKLLFTFKK